MKCLALALAALLAAGCAGETAVQPPTAATAPDPVTATALPTLAPTPTRAPTPSPTQAPEASVSVTGQTLLYEGSEFDRNVTSYQIIVSFTNDGTAPAKMSAFSSSYTLYRADGDVLTTGSFPYEYPEYLLPGETGYLADESSVEERETEFEGATIDAEVRYDDAEDRDVILVTTDRTRNRSQDFGGLITVGEVTNESDLDLDDVWVGAFYVDDDAEPLGFSYTNLVNNLAAGQTKGFETLSFGAFPKDPDDVAETVVFASGR